MTPEDILQKLTQVSDVSTWIPRDVYAGLIIEQAQANRLLAGVAGATEVQKEAGTGASVKVRYFPKRTAQGPIAEGVALTTTSSAPTVSMLTIQKYGDFDTMTHESIWQATDNVKARILGRMGQGLARKFDEVCYSALTGATPGTTKTLATAGDLVTNNDFLVKLMALVDAMRASLDVLPDTLVCGPDQINALAQTKVLDNRIGSAVQIDASGRPTSVYGLKVIDLFSIANRNVATAAALQAIVIDSSRAFGEVYGRAATFAEFYDLTKDQYQEVVWADYGAGVLDTAGIGFIKNP